jgi:hypothetical protein
LFNVLSTISIHNKRIEGYVQGMNFIVGTILINLENEEVRFVKIDYVGYFLDDGFFND